MQGSRPCKSCGKRTIIHDDETSSLVCSSCGIVQEFDDLQHHFGGLTGPTGTFVRTGTAGSGSTYSYKETKIYKAKGTIEHLTALLNLSPSKMDEVRAMVEIITEGEYGQGDWFPVFVGACTYVVMRKDNKSLPLVEVAEKVCCDVYEIGKMVSRVVEFLELKLPEFDIVKTFEKAVQVCFDAVSIEKGKIERMLKQGIFLVQCLVKWFLTTGRRPLPAVVSVLVFVAQLNDIDVQIEDLAKELNVAVATSRLRYKELLESLVKVAQALPWGKNITVKNIVKNAPFVIQYMELKSLSKNGVKKKPLERVELHLDDLISDCLMKGVLYGRDSYGTANDSQYFEIEGRSSSPRLSSDDLDKLKISHEGLSMINSELLTEISNAKAVEESGNNNKRKRGSEFDLSEYGEWWKGKSPLCKKLLLKQIMEKDVGLDAMPPSFINGCLANQRRREKIKAAKLRIKGIMSPPNAGSGDRDIVCVSECTSIGKKRRKKGLKIDTDWEDFIVETLLLHQVKEEEIEKGHYSTLLDLHVFNSSIK
ncbi:hypothetical protein NMG60_11012844 [Bertholletia excelsa]